MGSLQMVRRVEVAALALALVSFVFTSAHADDTNQTAKTSPDQPKIAAGQTWTYQNTDLITKAPSDQTVWTITEANDKTYTIKATFPNGSSALDVYDLNSNGIQYNAFKYSPNDGSGMPDGAKPGTTWKRSFTWRNSDKGNGGKADANGKCIDNEKITVAAGDFDTLKCTVTLQYRASNAGPVIFQDEITVWYAPEVLRYARREYVEKVRGQISLHKLEELSDYDLSP